MERTIKVTGKGNISVKPDMIRLVITQSNVQKEYEKAVSESAEMKGKLTESLEEIGFSKERLKTLYFNIDTEHESYETKSGSWRTRFAGYKYTHRMKLEFPSDNHILGKVLGVLSACAGQPEFSIQYTISDPESAKNELLAKAVADSKEKAKVLADAAGVKLGDIQCIDYSWGEIDFVSRPVNTLMLREASKCSIIDAVDLDIEADDINVTDTVTIIWTIE